jgi:hypothetical protein
MEQKNTDYSISNNREINMPYETTWEKKGIYWNLYGIVTGNDIEQLTIDVFGDSRFDDIRYVILDGMSIDDFVMSDDQLESVAAQDWAAAITNPNVKIAVITTHPRLIEVATMFGNMFGEHPWKISVHENIEEARRWCL